MKRNVRITIAGIAVNAILFGMKLAGGIRSGSLALLSDSFNSLNDIVASFVIFMAVRAGAKKADADHPFGHHRAEPIAGLVVAIFAAILGFEIIKNAFQGLFEREPLEVSALIFVIIGTGIAFKLVLYLLFFLEGKRSRSPALSASATDYRNDLIVSGSVLLGVLFGRYGISVADSVVALCVGLFIIYSGFRIGVENIDFLMGKRPGDEIVARLAGRALAVEGVSSLNEVKAHFLGNFVQIEVHIEVDRELSTESSHRIAKEVQARLLEDEIVDYAFVHVDPV
jgi:cation diffusion facilitator family transporter